MHDELEVRLLGEFSVRLNGQPLRSFRSAKTRGLLAYLAAQPDREHSRDSLATLLWGESTDQAAKTNLRIELSSLKKTLSDHPALEISRASVCFHSALAGLDAHRFQEVVGDFMGLTAEAQDQQLAQLVAAIDLYQGEFLAGFHLDDAIEYEDWQLIIREHLHALMMQALETLQLHCAEQGHWAELAAAARRQLALLPWHESAHQYLMQALASQGEIQAALAKYARCCQILQEEMGIEPSLAIQDLAARLRSGKPAAQPGQHNLRQQAKSFVGRSAERDRLHNLVQTENLVTIVGIGGMGKTHLALTVAQEMLHNFRDGVWFVPLASIPAGQNAHEQIALAIAAAIGYPVTDMQTPLAELLRYLADKRMLLVLDNWDHLADSAEFALAPLLNSTPVHVLATSRVRLKLQGENTLLLDGLPQDEAFTLFVERARRLVPSFATVEALADPASILRICQQVAGLPLGIELAASWVEHYAVDEISRTIAQIGMKPQQAGRMVERHQSLHAVFEYSWQLLSPAQQQILARLSIFHGGLDRDAATMIAESTLSDLSMLIGHSLVQRVTVARYDLHPLIQEFAGAKLTAEQAVRLQQKHGQHYLSTLATTPQDDWARLVVDFENMRSAWQRAVQTGDGQLIQLSVTVFGEFIARFGLMTEGEILLSDAVARFAEDGDNELVAQLLHQQWRFTRALRGLREAAALAERVLSTTASPALQIQAHIDLANANAEAGDWDQANLHFDGAEALLQQSSDLLTYIRTVETRTHINALHFRGDFAHGITRLQEMLTLLDTVEHPGAEEEEMRFRLLLSLSLLAVRHGDYALAIRCGLENLNRVASLSHRQKRVWVLLDLALAEQFAGLFDTAASHDLEALALAAEISAMDDVGLLSANLCLTLRQTDRVAEGLAYGRTGVEILNSHKILRQEGQARNRVGHTLLALQCWDDAHRAYGEALGVWETLEHPNRYEALAGQAVAAFHLNRRDEATRLVEEALSFVKTAGLQGIVEPVLLLLNGETVLSGLGQKERALAVLQQAQAWIEQIAARISDEAIQRAFLKRPDNNRLSDRLRTAMAGSRTLR
jgi:predicted ATPase/DNA-binding SARP family transcriptional activator/tetratricopeptide (TPR) repeat protein